MYARYNFVTTDGFDGSLVKAKMQYEIYFGRLCFLSHEPAWSWSKDSSTDLANQHRFQFSQTNMAMVVSLNSFVQRNLEAILSSLPYRMNTLSLGKMV